MDAVNRKIAMSMMMKEASLANAIQYILITPQNMTNANNAPGARVIRLGDPERNQGTLALA